MGIKPDANAVAASYPDTAQERFGDLVNIMEEDGKAAGEVFAEVAATAESANSGAAELAADLTALEGRVDALEHLIADVTATADSANTAAGELAAKIAGLEQRIESLKNAIIAVPPANLADLETGQVYMDVPTLTIHTK